MMADRRSGRARKQVNYSNFDTELDDDFADTTPPPNKKQKKDDSTVEDKKQLKVKPAPKLSARSSRVPLDEKLYERDLQAALELSLVSSQSQSEPEPQSQTQRDEGSDIKTVTVAIVSGPVLHSTPLSVETEEPGVKETGEQTSPTILPSAIACGVADDDIEILGTVNCSDKSPEKKRRATTTKKNSVYVVDDDSEGDEDFSANEASDSESAYEDQNDSDFDDDKPKGKAKAAKGRQKATAADKTKPGPAAKRTKTASKNTASAPTIATAPPSSCIPLTPKMTVPHVYPKPAATAKPITASPVKNRTATGAAVKRPAWTPPGQSSSESLSAGVSTLKSPSSGLRLGLSRNVRVKPLHPSLKVT